MEMEGEGVGGGGKLLLVTIPAGRGGGDLLLITDPSTGLEYNVTVPVGCAEGEELEVEVDPEAEVEAETDGQEVEVEGSPAGLTLSPTRPPSAGCGRATPERSPTEEATPPSPEVDVSAGKVAQSLGLANNDSELLHLSPKRPTRPPPARPSPTRNEATEATRAQEAAHQPLHRSPLRASPIPNGSPKHGSPAQCSPTTPAARRVSAVSPVRPQMPQPTSPAVAEEATPPVPVSPPPKTGGGPVSEASALAASKRSPPGRPPPRPVPGAVERGTGSPSTPTKRSPQVPTTPRPLKTPDGTPEAFEEATPPKQSDLQVQIDGAAAEGDPLRLSAVEDPHSIPSGASPSESPKRKPSRPPPVPDAARRASGQATPSPARAGAGPGATSSTSSTSSQSGKGLGTMGSTVSAPSPNLPKLPPKSPDVLKRMRQLSKPDTDSDRPSSPAMSSISEAPSGASSSGSRDRSDGLTPQPDPEPEQEPEPQPVSAAVAAAALAQAKATAAAEAEKKASLREFWIPFNEIKFGAPIDSGAFGTVYRGNYLGPVAVKSIRQQADTFSHSNGSAPDKSSAQDDSGASAAEIAELEDVQAQRLLLSGQTRLIEEIRAQTRFHHQNVVQFLGLASGRPPHSPSALHWLVVTELCDQNLYQVLRNGRDLPWNTRFKLGLDIAQGMTYLHEKQHMAHLDLKSPNVLLKGKDAKLADFGSLRRLRARPRVPRRRPPAKKTSQRAAGAGPSGDSTVSSAAGTRGPDHSLPDAQKQNDDEDAAAETTGPRLLSFGGVGGMSDEQAAAMARVHAAVESGSGSGAHGEAVLANAAAGGGSQGVEAAVAEMQEQLGLSEQDARKVATSLNSTRNNLLLLGSDGSGGYGTYDGGSYAEQEGGIGTPEWLAPELLAVEAPGTPGRSASTRGVDWQAADRYSYGVILWELLTRKRPYEGYRGAAAVAKIGPTIVPVWAYEGERPAWPAGSATPKEWRELCDKCWDGVPQQRPPFKEIVESLRAMYPHSKQWPHPDKLQVTEAVDAASDKERAAAAAAERAERCAAQAQAEGPAVEAAQTGGADGGGAAEKAQ